MNFKINDLSKYSREDSEKINLIEDVLKEFYKPLMLKSIHSNLESPKFDLDECDYSEDRMLCAPDLADVFVKYCPECGREFPEGENVCFDCLVHLKNISDRIEVCEIKSNPQFVFDGENSYESFEKLLSAENLLKIDDFNFSIGDYSDVLHNIKAQALRNFDNLVKENEIVFDNLDILDKILLFSKSFVPVDYKSYGEELGYFEKNTIYIDDRQTDSLQITTLIHELAHFLIKEILSGVLCRILDSTKNQFTDSLITFILSYTPFTRLIDEYSAHNVEGRFTVFGFQDYSSYEQIESSLDGEMTVDEIEITKSIGNTFAISIKDILESLIDKTLREEIKEQFLNDVMDRPNYRALRMENCQMLNDEGFIKALWLILNDGCQVAVENLDTLKNQFH